MSEDLSEFIALSRPARMACGVGIALDGLSAVKRAKVREALAADQRLISHQAISDWLKTHAHITVKAYTIGRHRKGRCSCAH